MVKTPPLRRRIVNEFVNKDAIEFLKSSQSYLWRYPLYQTFFSLKEEDALSSAECLEISEVSSSVEFTYNGIWDPPHPEQITKLLGKKTIYPRKIYKFDTTTIIGHRPFVLSNNRIFCPSNIGTSTQKGKYEIRYRDLVALTTNQYLKDSDIEIGFLISGNSPEFAHWPTEILTKLRYYERVKNCLNRNVNLVICPGSVSLSRWQKKSLKVLGYSHKDYYVHNGAPLQFDELILPSHKYLGSFSTKYPSPTDLRWVQNRAVTNQDSVFGDRIYISRRDANRRRVRNESEVEEILSEFDFQTYVPGELPYSEQVSLFAGAEVIVGPHGAGMMNALYSQNATLIELMSESKKNVHHFCLSNLIDIDYEYVTASSVKREDVNPRHYDIIVDCEKLTTVLESYL